MPTQKNVEASMKIIMFLVILISGIKVFAENPDRESWAKIKSAQQKIAQEFADVVEPDRKSVV